MFEGITQSWGEIAHISEITGLSIFAIIGCGVVVYLDPTARKFAIRTAVLVVAGYSFFIFAYHQGSADKKAQWDQANAEAAEARKTQDADVNQFVAKKYDPIIATEQHQAETNDHATLANLSAAATTNAPPTGGPCRLGAAPLRLRNHK
jgi:O-methyltransferase involved in polyketide biosynthesis